MTFWSAAILFLYATAVVGLLIYGLNCYVLLGISLWHWQKRRKSGEPLDKAEALPLPAPPREDWPVVTTQIPLYNEYNVSERVIRAVAAMSYPQGKHEVQVLDDSTDESRDLIDEVVAAIQREQPGLDIKVFRREDRQGYKAGALQEGMKVCRGEFIAIFDSDFVPQPEFLEIAVPELMRRPDTGLIQGRWTHLNAEDSFLTGSQAVGIDGHFAVEQLARAYGHLFMNFNGTAGLWRKQAIIEAGGWEADTLTEDMDLSYRAQLAGWKLHYEPDLAVPSELPSNFRDFKSQQFRWAKGSIQTAMKIFPRVLRSNRSWLVKLQAWMHLTQYSIHPMMVMMAVFALPAQIFVDLPFTDWFLVISGLLILFAALGPNTMYFASQRLLYAENWTKRIVLLPVLMSVGVGVAVSNTRAVLEAVAGVKSNFVRTPKKGNDARRRKNYNVARSLTSPVLEIGLGLLCLAAVVSYVMNGLYFALPFLIIYTCGFLLVGISSLIEEIIRFGPSPGPEPKAA